MSAVYSDAPIPEGAALPKFLAALPASRFLDAERQLPYRDEHGHINTNLLNYSADRIAALEEVPEALEGKLSKWLRHAERWVLNHRSSAPPARPPACVEGGITSHQARRVLPSLPEAIQSLPSGAAAAAAARAMEDAAVVMRPTAIAPVDSAEAITHAQPHGDVAMPQSTPAESGAVAAGAGALADGAASGGNSNDIGATGSDAAESDAAASDAVDSDAGGSDAADSDADADGDGDGSGRRLLPGLPPQSVPQKRTAPCYRRPTTAERRCGLCIGCEAKARRATCGECVACRDMRKYGGPCKSKRPCQTQRCLRPLSPQAVVRSPEPEPADVPLEELYRSTRSATGFTGVVYKPSHNKVKPYVAQTQWYVPATEDGAERAVGDGEDGADEGAARKAKKPTPRYLGNFATPVEAAAAYALAARAAGRPPPRPPLSPREEKRARGEVAHTSPTASGAIVTAGADSSDEDGRSPSGLKRPRHDSAVLRELESAITRVKDANVETQEVLHGYVLTYRPRTDGSKSLKGDFTITDPTGRQKIKSLSRLRARFCGEGIVDPANAPACATADAHARAKAYASSSTTTLTLPLAQPLFLPIALACELTGTEGGGVGAMLTLIERLEAQGCGVERVRGWSVRGSGSRTVFFDQAGSRYKGISAVLHAVNGLNAATPDACNVGAAEGDGVRDDRRVEEPGEETEEETEEAAEEGTEDGGEEEDEDYVEEEEGDGNEAEDGGGGGGEKDDDDDDGDEEVLAVSSDEEETAMVAPDDALKALHFEAS